MRRQRPSGDLIRGYAEPVKAVGSEQRETPELRSTTSPVTVRLSRMSRDAMRDEVFWLTRLDNAEAGGFLFAKVARSWDREIRIFHATTTGDNAIRRNDSLLMDVSRWQDAERWIEGNGWHDTALVGTYHSHPDVTGKDAGLPSENDLRVFLAARDRMHRTRGAAYSVGLIVTQGRSSFYGSEFSWATPELHCWVTRRTAAGTPITERANVEGWR